MPISHDQIFSRKNTRILLGFVGACVVFITFVAKDDRRDDMKSLADLIDGAENIFIIRTENARLEDEQHRVTQELNHLVTDFREFRKNPHPYSDSGFGGGSSTWGFTSKEFEADREKEQNVEVAFDNIVRLLRKLSNTETHSSEVASIKHDMGQFRSMCDEINTVWSRHKSMTLHNAEWQKTDRELDDRFDKLEDQLGRISASTNALSKGILERAEEAREKAEKSFQFWNRVSYVLYMFGALLTMVGVAIGVEGPLDKSG